MAKHFDLVIGGSWNASKVRMAWRPAANYAKSLAHLPLGDVSLEAAQLRPRPRVIPMPH
jgi:hypothetical protein